MKKQRGFPFDNWLITSEAAEKLGVTRRHIQELCENGELECVRIGQRLWLVSKKSIEVWKPKRIRRKEQHAKDEITTHD